MDIRNARRKKLFPFRKNSLIGTLPQVMDLFTKISIKITRMVFGTNNDILIVS